MSLYLGTTPIANDGLHRLTGEIGDIGIAPLGIDESLNLRRYLNGQVISQTQFEPFTTKVKSAVALFPTLATTEANWQAEKALSKFGQVGKFVIDDENQTIRLPAVVNVQGLLELSGIGNLVNESLPNITGAFGTTGSGTTATGAFYRETGSMSSNSGGSANTDHTEFDASLSSPTYQIDAPVQQEAIQYPFYIQVATGIEEELPTIREYKVNNSDYFGKSMYSDVEPNNASLLASNGQYNARTIYPDYYDWLVSSLGKDHIKGMIGYAFKKPNEEIRWWTAKRNPEIGDVVFGGFGIQKIGVVNKVNSDGTIGFYEAAYSIQQDNLTYTESENINVEGTGFNNIVWANDYDFVVNQNDQTFRLPLLNGEENLPGSTFTIEDITQPKTFTAEHNMYVSCNVNISGTGRLLLVINNTTSGIKEYNEYNGAKEGAGCTLFAKKGDSVTYGFASGGFTITQNKLILNKAVGNGTLYYYVGDTVQDASLINAGVLLNEVASLKARRYVTETYKNGTEWYRIWSDGWIEQGGHLFTQGANQVNNLLVPFTSSDYDLQITGGYASTSTNAVGWGNAQTTTTFTTSGPASTVAVKWQACGY